ncbi:Actin, cytoplasmic 2 [Manis javanica]|nr:Actin, cytoplasmic 2 [Manis javanica]
MGEPAGVAPEHSSIDHSAGVSCRLSPGYPLSHPLEPGPALTTEEEVLAADRGCLRDMKEKRCSVAVDLNKEKEEADLPSYAQKYRLPDGQEINVGQKRFLRPEGLFQTNLIGEPCEGNRGRTSLGAHMTALQSTGRATLLSGRVSSATLCCLAGTGSCSGLQFRMQKEISALVSPTINVKV